MNDPIDAIDASAFVTGSLSVSSDQPRFWTFFGGQSAQALSISNSGLITIYDEKGAKLVQVNRDGTVETSFPGAEQPAAKQFWDAVQHCGVNLVARVRELEGRLAKYETVQPW